MSFLFLTILGPLLGIVCCSNEDLCPRGTKIFQHKDGSLECLVCSLCPRGKVKVANCSVDNDTICKSCDDFSYYDDKEPHCRPCTGCPQGEFIKRPCSQFLDSDCGPCPNGTFSSRPNSSSCANCSVCTEGYGTECSKTNDAICNKTGTLSGGNEESGPVGIVVECVVGITVALITVTILVIMFYKKRQLCFSKPGNRYDISQPHEIRIGSKDQDTTEETELLVSNHKEADLVKINELKEKQMEREDDMKKLTVREQLLQLSFSVGKLVSSKLIVESASEKNQEDRNLAVCFVGSKYIMTAYFPVRDICGTTENGEIKHSSFEDHDVYVAFNEPDSPNKIIFKIRASKPAYTNKVLDIIVLEIYPSSETATAETRKEMSGSRTLSNENNINDGSSGFPPSFCLHTSIPLSNVQNIEIILFDKEDGGILLYQRNNLLKSRTGPLNDVFTYLYEHENSLEKFGEEFLKYSVRDLTDVGKTKVCWTLNYSNAICFGSPGIICDPTDGCCRLLCICTGRVPKIIDNLPLEQRRPFNEVKTVRIGTLMSSVYTDIKVNNPDLAKELFYEFDEDQKA